MRFWLKVVLSAAVAGMMGAWGMIWAPRLGLLPAPWQPGQISSMPPSTTTPAPDDPTPRNIAQTPPGASSETVSRPFVEASRQARPSVVFVRVVSEASRPRRSSYDFFYHFFEDRGPVSSFGSGVIMRSDGYIITNRHVVQGGASIEIILSDGQTSYPAELVGSDPSTDLAILKVDAQGLPTISFADSDALDIGAWVLAVGNPFNLTSTVTTGIVSAKGRNIDVVDNPFPIESFIQTDAAINPGNSGGALVNLDGQLVGINTAILSETGSYAGYGFAIPSNIVRKVAHDIIEYGLVQRAFIEAEMVELGREEKRRRGLDGRSNILVADVSPNGNADAAGLRRGDIVTAINGEPVSRYAQLSEKLAYHSPGDAITLSIIRDDKERSLRLTLVNSEGETGVLRLRRIRSDALGADFQEITKIEKERYGTPTGVKVTRLRNGAMKRIGLEEGFIITAVNNQPARSAEKLVALLENGRGRVYLEGLDANGRRRAFSFYLY